MQRGLTGHYVPLASAAGRRGTHSGHWQSLRLGLARSPAAPSATDPHDCHTSVELKLSVPTMIMSMKQLAKLGITRETTGRNYARIYAYDKYLKILNEGTEPLDRLIP